VVVLHHSPGLDRTGRFVGHASPIWPTVVAGEAIGAHIRVIGAVCPYKLRELWVLRDETTPWGRVGRLNL